MYLFAHRYNCQPLRNGACYYELIRLPGRLRWSHRQVQLPYLFLQEHTRISQVPDASLHACHGLITPPILYSLTISGCFAWTSTALQVSSIETSIFGAMPALQGHVSPVAYMILCVRFIRLVRE